MKVLIQRVTRASLEVDGMVEARIGSGLLLSMAARKGDSVEKAKKLAAQIVKLMLWPDIYDPEKLWKSSVVDNGFEILAMSQQSLAATFPQLVPSEDTLSEEDATKIFEAFVEALKKGYQEEMVVAAPLKTETRVETVNDGPCIFELDTTEPAALGRQPVTKAAISAAKEMPKKITTKPGEAGSEDAKQEDDLDRKLAQLRDEVEGKAPGKKGIKEELQEEARVRPDWQGRAAPNTPAGMQAPPWQQRGRSGFGYGGGFMAEWSQGYGKGGGKGGKSFRPPGRSYGIASLDESARIHGARGGSAEYGQLSALPDHQMKVGSIKKELGADGEANDDADGPKRPAGKPAGGPLKRPKGMPTVAPMTPAFTEPADAYEEL